MDLTPFLPLIQSLGPWGLVAATVLGAIHVWRRGGANGVPPSSPNPVAPVAPGGPQSPFVPFVPLVPASDRPILDAILRLLKDAASRRSVQSMQGLATADVPLSVASVPVAEHASDPSAVHTDNFTSWLLVDLVETRYAMDAEIAKRKEKLKLELAML